MTPKRIDKSSRTSTHYKKWRQEASEYLGQWDLQGADGRSLEPTVVIESVEQYQPAVIRKRKGPDGVYRDEPNRKYVIAFAGKRKKWICGPVSQDAIAAIHGTRLEGWIGQRITLYVDASVEMGGVRVGGIRVRPLAPKDEPTTDPLDRPVDDDAGARMHEASGRSEFDEETGVVQ
jgi:hypothetical protein